MLTLFQFKCEREVFLLPSFSFPPIFILQFYSFLGWCATPANNTSSKNLLEMTIYYLLFQTLPYVHLLWKRQCAYLVLKEDIVYVCIWLERRKYVCTCWRKTKKRWLHGDYPTVKDYSAYGSGRPTWYIGKVQHYHPLTPVFNILQSFENFELFWKF